VFDSVVAAAGETR